jgi:hypothetical protein
MPQMEIANVMVNLGGDAGNQVPKYEVTVSEIAVLIGIHGEEAVHDIEPLGFVDRPNHAERQRLMEFYGKIQDGRDMSPVGQLFPGANARMFQHLAELHLDESFFKAVERVKPAEVTEEPASEERAPPIETMEADEGDFDVINDAHTAPEVKASKAAPKRAPKPAAPKDDIFG